MIGKDSLSIAHSLYVNHNNVKLSLADIYRSSYVIPHLLTLNPPPPQQQLLQGKLGTRFAHVFWLSLVNVGNVAYQLLRRVELLVTRQPVVIGSVTGNEASRSGFRLCRYRTRSFWCLGSGCGGRGFSLGSRFDGGG